ALVLSSLLILRCVKCLKRTSAELNVSIQFFKTPLLALFIALLGDFKTVLDAHLNQVNDDGKSESSSASKTSHDSTQLTGRPVKGPQGEFLPIKIRFLLRIFCCFTTTVVSLFYIIRF